MTTESCKNGATTLSRINFSGYVEHATIFSWMFDTIACSLVIGLGLGLGLWLGCDLVSDWLVVSGYTHVRNLYYFPLWLSHCSSVCVSVHWRTVSPFCEPDFTWLFLCSLIVGGQNSEETSSMFCYFVVSMCLFLVQLLLTIIAYLHSLNCFIFLQ